VTGVAPARPDRLVFVTGTTTGVGKTWWSAAMARHLRAAGMTVAARKPVQSGAAGEVSDAEVLASATGERVTDVTPQHRTYLLAWAPPMAAAELGRPAFSVADLAAETTWPSGVAVGIVEGVGGPRSPVAADGDNVALAELLQPDLVVLVADAGLGTINAVRLCVPALGDRAVVVALNRYRDEPLHARNRDVLVADGLRVVTSPDATLTAG
jgi:dethiobiotin synthetase